MPEQARARRSLHLTIMQNAEMGFLVNMCAMDIKIMLRKVCAGLLTIILLVAAFVGCSGGAPASQSPPGAQSDALPVSETRLFLSTFCTLTLYGEHDSSLLEEAFDLCAEYDALFSRTLEGSDVWRINHAGGAAVIVAPETIEVIKAGVGFGEISEGMFDITIGRVSALWDFSNDPHLPSEAELADARAGVDYRQVSIEGDTVRLLDAEAWLDLGGIAKGYIANRVADYLVERGVTGAVIDLGGDVAVIGEKPDGSPWLVGVRKPFGGKDDLIGIIETAEASVVTSGIYQRMFQENGIIYHHILDPFTGTPSGTDVVSAAVVVQDSAVGDALSTIAVLVGSEAAPGIFAQTPGFIGAILMLESGELMQLGDIDFLTLD